MWRIFDRYGAEKQNFGSIPNYGWDVIPATLTYLSADGHTFVCSTGVDLSGLIPLGARIQVTHAATQKFFIVTAISGSSITLYGGTDYALSAGAITNPLFSIGKAPMGFPLNKDKWTEQFTDTGQRQQATPASGTWYNQGTAKLDVPIGSWDIEYEVAMECLGTSTAAGTVTCQVFAALSTSTSAISDAHMTSEEERWAYSANSGAAAGVNPYFYRRKSYVFATKTSLYLISSYQSSNMATPSQMGYRGDLSATIIRAVCAYL